MIEAIVGEPLVGARLDRFVAALDGIGSRTAAGQLVEEGRVLVDGEPRHKSFRLLPGMHVAVDAPARIAVSLEADPSVAFTVVYEDAAIVVVDKPAGVVVHPAPGVREGTLVQGLVARGIAGGDDAERPGIVHRLDRDTSGLLVVARTEAAHRSLGRALRRREIEREYAALIHGRPAARSGRIEAPIGRDRGRGRMAVDGGAARSATTRFEIDEALGRFTLLTVRLETGRTHQIRVHLEAIGHPVVGDPVYAPASAERLGLARQFLHARRLVLPHPVTGERLELEAALPPDLAAALERAGRDRVSGPFPGRAA